MTMAVATTSAVKRQAVGTQPEDAAADAERATAPDPDDVGAVPQGPEVDEPDSTAADEPDQPDHPRPAAGSRAGWLRPGVVVLALVVGLLVGYAVALLTQGGEETPGETSPEAGFARDMSIHHAQAVEMGLIAFERATLPGVRQLGYDIATNQQGQIGMMQQWLTEWGLMPTGVEPPMAWMPEGTDALVDGLMPGMANAEEINALREAEGEEVDRLFLHLMLYHHLGGIHMAEGILKQSDHPHVTAAAELMLVNQQYEVEVIQDLQRELEAAQE